MSELNLMKTHKRFYAAAVAMEMTLSLPKQEKIMVKLRASFVNGCGYCIRMHSREALKLGLGQDWVNALEAWPATHELFDARENLILSFTTADTRLPDRSFDPDLLDEVIAELGEKTTGDLIATIATINMWNRIGVLSQK